jgi:hypothetical protein
MEGYVNFGQDKMTDTVLEIQGKQYLQNPQGQIMDSTGDNVAVAVSYGYGSGWSTWNTDNTKVANPTNATVVRALLQKRRLTLHEMKQLDDPYDGGYDGLGIEWHSAGTWVKMTEFDGAEWVEVGNENNGFFLHPSIGRQEQQERENREKNRRQRHLEQWGAIGNDLYQEVLHTIQMASTEPDRIVNTSDRLRLQMGDRVFLVHAFVVRTIPYFRVLMESGFKESVEKTSTLEITKPVVADCLVEFMYRGEVGKGYETCKEELISLADMLQYHPLLEYMGV